jgi:uncharacterized protein YkwD
MLTKLGTRRAKLLAATVVVAALSTACYGGAAGGGGGGSASLPSSGTVQELYNLTNAARASNGLPALGWNNQLGGLAQDWSGWMAATGSMTHRDLWATINSPPFWQFQSLGENILQGGCGISAAQMHQAWMNSAGHRANILSGGYNVIGIGVVCDGAGRVWATQDFGLI